MNLHIGDYFEQGLCISCGVCAGNCPKSCITMKKDGYHIRPVVNTSLCIHCGLCRSVCPNSSLSAPDLDDKNISVFLLGNYKEIFCASSKDKDLLSRSTSGGVVTTLVKALLNSGSFQSAFLVSGYNFLSQPLCTKRFGPGDSLDSTQKSRYLTVDHSEAVRYMLSNRKERIIFVGTPCAISGIRNTIQKHNLKRNQYLLIGLFCDKTMHYGVAHYFANYKKSNKEMDELFFRTKDVGGWPGGVRIHYKDGSVLDLKNTERMKVKEFFTPERCLYCLDKLNRGCDISAGDNYIPDNSNSEGRSSIIIRTETGAEIWEQCKYLFDYYADDANALTRSASLNAKISNYYYGCLKGIYHTDKAIPDSTKSSYRALLDKMRIGNKANVYQAIQRFFKKKARSKNKPSLVSIIHKGFRFVWKQIRTRPQKRGQHGKTFLVWGANFNNKGAQAMLFTTVAELKARFPGCTILFNTTEKNIPDCFQFEPVYFNEKQLNDLKRNAAFWYFKLFFVLIIRRRLDIVDYYFSRKKFKSVDALLDISGFALSSQFGFWIPNMYLKMLEASRHNRIPVFLMPQSFGPFDFSEKKDDLIPRIKEDLKYPTVIFPREESGYKLLSSAPYNLSNVARSVDLVLQNKSIDTNLVSSEPIIEHNCDVDTVKNVAIIPNLRTIDCGGATRGALMDLYIHIISELTNNGFCVYLLRHSGEDLSICTDLYDAIEDKTNLFLRIDDYNCVEFNNLVKHFDFVIGSRYHSIIHAYKNAVPAVVLGWAEKYSSLVSLFEQSQYMFDIQNFIASDEEPILNAVKKMEKQYSTERAKIQQLLPKWQEENCFDAISKFFAK